MPPTQVYYYVTINDSILYDKQSLSGANPVSTKPKVKLVNTLNLESLKPSILDEKYFENLSGIPRPERPIIMFDAEPEPEWDFKDSIFYGYIPDSDDLLKKGFEYDWDHCKIPKMIKNVDEQEKIKQYLGSKYKQIRETYKYYAGISPGIYVPSIGQNAFVEIINLTTIVDGNYCKLSDIDFEFIATKAGNKKIQLNPERWLVRYQFMEIFVRIALHKYFKPANNDSGSKITESEAVFRIFEEQLLEHFEKHNAHNWREQKLWNKECDTVLKSYQKELKRLYDKYSGKYSKPGKPIFVSIDEFQTMIGDSGILYGGSIGPGEIGALFNVSMMTQIKELDHERHTNMFFLEFIEAICRVAYTLKEFPKE